MSERADKTSKEATKKTKQSQSKETANHSAQYDDFSKGSYLQKEPLIDPNLLTPDAILQLQRFVGNHQVKQLINQKSPPDPKQAISYSDVILRQETDRIQRFDSDEHMKLGDDATKGKHGEAKTVQLADGYQITYGEMVAMAGDYFESISQIRQFAANDGKGKGTREEIEYVINVKINKIKTGTYTDGAKKAVESRYYELALGNRSHFLNPEIGDENRSVEDKGDDLEIRQEWTKSIFPQVVKKTIPLSAGTGYRKNHFQALYEAYFAGYNNDSIDAAMAVEAFSSHYLTDAFASGHVRTPRGSINEYWNKRVPLFNYNLKGLIAELLADELAKGSILTKEITYKGGFGKKGALEKVTSSLDQYGIMTFGDVVSGAIHDYDNKKGVKATILGEDVTLYGDGHLGEGSEETFATDAIRLSVQDVELAWEAGKDQGNPLSLLVNLLQDGLFASEQLLPKPKSDSELPESDDRIKWDCGIAETLLSDGKFAEGLRIFIGEKAKDLEAAGGDLDKDQKQAFKDKVIKPLKSDPIGMMKQVLNWTPNTGGGVFGHNQDDNALDYYEKAKKENVLDTLTLKQKKRLINDLLDGATIGDEEDAIMRLLKVNGSDAKKLIKAIGWGRLEDNIDDGWGSDFADSFPKSKYAK